MKHEAIYNLYPNVRTIDEDDNGNFVVKDENRNEVTIDMSAVNTKATELQTIENVVDVVSPVMDMVRLSSFFSSSFNLLRQFGQLS